MIHEALAQDICYAKDLVEPVSRKLGKPVSHQKIFNYLHVMYESNEVKREPETRGGSFLRYRWYTNRVIV